MVAILNRQGFTHADIRNVMHKYRIIGESEKLEMSLWRALRVAEIDLPGQFAPDKTRCALKSFDRLFSGFSAAVYGDPYLAGLQIGSDLDGDDAGQRADPGIFQIPDDLRKRPLHLVVDPAVLDTVFSHFPVPPVTFSRLRSAGTLPPCRPPGSYRTRRIPVRIRSLP